jgi:tRNA nucleotidyltransferase (CCA-adding enzyme)
VPKQVSPDPTHRYLRGPEAGEALRIIAKLREAGFVAYLAGGCVRDALLGKPPKDFDVATDATPDAIRRVFGRSRTMAFGASFGVIGVLPPKQTNSGERDQDARSASDVQVESASSKSKQAESKTPEQPTEVATFRSDGHYSDGRRPDSVHFGDAKHDALRRDFTINGLFYDPQDDRVIDFVGGQEDLRSRILRTIGDPIDRFGEDKLRMLRAVRFATTLEFDMEPATLRAILEHADDIGIVSGERIGAEMRRVVLADQAVSGLGHLMACGLDRVVWPEVAEIDSHRARRRLTLAGPPEFCLRMACLLSFVQRPLEALRTLAERWRLSNDELRRIGSALVHWPTILQTRSLAWSTIQPILIHRDAPTIVALAAAIARSEDPDRAIGGGGSEDVAAAQEAIAWPADRLNPPPLLTGEDLKSLGIPAGPLYATLLQTARNDQLDGRITTRAEAIARIDLRQLQAPQPPGTAETVD